MVDFLISADVVSDSWADSPNRTERADCISRGRSWSELLCINTQRRDARMFEPEVVQAMEVADHKMLEWIGFGTLVGLTAKAVMPGRDPGGAFTTMTIGMVGSVIGCGIAMYSFGLPRLTPISLHGFGAATAGAFILLALYRLMSGRVIREGVDPDFGERTYRRRAA